MQGGRILPFEAPEGELYGVLKLPHSVDLRAFMNLRQLDIGNLEYETVILTLTDDSTLTMIRGLFQSHYNKFGMQKTTLLGGFINRYRYSGYRVQGITKPQFETYKEFGIKEIAVVSPEQASRLEKEVQEYRTLVDQAVRDTEERLKRKRAERNQES